MKEVSITFRLSALSAQDSELRCDPSEAVQVSITFRLSALSALTGAVESLAVGNIDGLNYLSAQCPFGTRNKNDY